MNKQALIEAILAEGLFHMEAPVAVTNGLGTYALIFPSDLEKSEILAREIDEAMSHAASPRDDAAINLLRHLPETPADEWATIGLYLALADAVSRRNFPLEEKKTLLSAMRANDAILPLDQRDYSREKLLESAKAALDNLWLGPEFASIITQWAENGSFTFAGEKQSITQNAQGQRIIAGDYMQLAAALEGNLNRAISYALGNKQAQGLLTNCGQQELLKNVQVALVDSCAEMRRRISIGEGIRKQRLRDAAEEAVKERGNSPADNAMPAAILQYLPVSALQLLLRAKMQVCYTDDANIRSLYAITVERSPNLSKERIAVLQNSVAMRDEYHNMIFLSNGQRPDPEGLSPEQIKDLHAKRGAQSLLHELFHDAFATMPPKSKKGLLRAAARVALPKGAESRLPFETMSVSSVADIMDFQKYGGYSEKEQKQEEVLCNLFSLSIIEPGKLPKGYQYELLYGAIKQAFERAVNPRQK